MRTGALVLAAVLLALLCSPWLAVAAPAAGEHNGTALELPPIDESRFTDAYDIAALVGLVSNHNTLPAGTILARINTLIWQYAIDDINRQPAVSRVTVAFAVHSVAQQVSLVVRSFRTRSCGSSSAKWKTTSATTASMR
jgi:hypothetical protein